MPEERERASERDEPEIADAAQLFRDDAPSPPPARLDNAVVAPSEADAYAIEEGESASDEPPPAAAAPRTQKASPRPSRSSSSSATAATVDQLWSRTAEWGPNLALLVIVGLFIVLLVYQTSSDLALSFFLLVLGCAVMLVLSYPLVITLERPVRITPEQAVNDYFGALEHHVPHFRRMWLLLSSAGRVSSSYASFEGFKAYWKNRLAQLRGDRAGKLTPLVFKIDDFKSEKSAGQSAIDAKFTVNVFIRGRQNDGPIESIRVALDLVRGSDQMWYLNKGTLPGARI
jgi:hypothetical protein